MQAVIEEMPEIRLGNDGVMIRVRNESGENVGKLWIGQATLRWAPGKVHEKNARRLSMTDFVAYLNKLPAS